MIKWISAPAFRRQLPRRLWLQVWFGFALAMAPLWWFQPFLLSLLLLGAALAKLVALWRGRMWWGWLALLVVLPLGLLQIYANYRSEGMTFSFLALLSLMNTAKLIESRNERDCQILFLSELTLMMMFLMYSQAIWMFFYLLLVLGYNLLVQIRIVQRDSRVIHLGRWQGIGKLMTLALPVAMLMFFFFPRIEPLWGIPRAHDRNVTGLPDEMDMGDIASLAQSNELAFRVRFADGQLPPPAARYWRGTTLWTFDGKRWLQRPQGMQQAPPRLAYQPDGVLDYDLMPVKASLQWLPALDLPLSYPDNLRIGASYQLKLPDNHQIPARYHLTSAMQYRTVDELSHAARAAALQLPDDVELSQTRALAQRLYRQGGSNATGFAQAFSDYIRTEPFYYTLEPPPGMGNAERFLFNERMGFCEHYASAMVQAARSVGIPARVVIGYQGGELNPLNGDFLVREESAHAWVELWDDERGWFRADPTAAVAPERVNQGELTSTSLQGQDRRALSSRLSESMASIAWLRHAYAATNAFWQDWVIDLNRDRQGSLLEKLGLKDLGDWLLLVILLLGVGLGLTLLWVWWQCRPRYDDDAVAKAMRRLLKRLHKAGLQRGKRESVATFLRRVAPLLQPDSAAQLKQISNYYEQVRYHESLPQARLLDAVRRFRYRE